MPPPRVPHSARQRAPAAKATRNTDWRLEGISLPSWWPLDPLTGEPLHKVFRAASVDLNELFRHLDLPADYPTDQALSQLLEYKRATLVFNTVDRGSQRGYISPFLHASRTEAGARYFFIGGKTDRGNKHAILTKMNLLTMYKEGHLHMNSFVDLSTEYKFNKFFYRGPYEYNDQVRENWNKVLNNATRVEEMLFCWRGEVPLHCS